MFGSWENIPPSQYASHCWARTCSSRLLLWPQCKRKLVNNVSSTRSGPQNKTLRCSWVALPTQEHRGYFFPIYSFPTQMALEERRTPTFMQSLLGAGTVLSTLSIGLINVSQNANAYQYPQFSPFFLGTQLNVISLSLQCGWKQYTSFPNLARRNLPHSLPLSLPLLPAEWCLSG